jgi:predicted membrane protein
LIGKAASYVVLLRKKEMERIDVSKKPCCKGVKGIVFGLLVVATGIVLMMKNLGSIDPFWSSVLISWPALIMAIGFINLFGREFPFGLLIITAGSLFMASKFFGLPINFSAIIWPAIIILAGIIIIAGNRIMKKRAHWTKTTSTESFVEEVNVFGGNNHTITSQEFKGGKLVNVFGGTKIDLLQAGISPQGCEIELICVFGGVGLIIPSDWTVKTQVVSLFGGFGDKRIVSGNVPEKTIIIKGVCVFGGGEIKSIPD